MNGKIFRKPEVTRLIRLLILLLALAGVLIEIFTTRLSREIPFLFRFYTIQTNLFAASSMLLLLLIRNEKGGYFWIARLFSNTASLWILITGVLYGLLLSGLYHPVGWKYLSNLLLHTITPLMMVAHELVLSKPMAFRRWLPAVWVSYPLIYAVVSGVYGIQFGFFPYWFLNPTQNYPHGAGSLLNVALIVGMLMIGFIGFGLLMLRLNRRIQNQ